MSSRLKRAPQVQKSSRYGVSYGRVSTMDQGFNDDGSRKDDASPEAQKERCRLHLESLDKEHGVKHELIEHLSDEGFSGKNLNRPCFQRLWQLIATRKIGFVIATELSRLSRSVSDFAQFIEHCARHEVDLYVVGMKFDTSTPHGKMVMNILISLAQYEREITGVRVRDNSLVRLIKDGKINGAGELLGLDRDPKRPGHFLVNPDELVSAETILRLFLKLPSKLKTLKIAREQGITGKRGAELVPSMIDRILENTALRYRGIWYANPENRDKSQDTLPPSKRFQEVKLPHGPLLPIDLLDQAHAKLADTQMQRKRTGKDDYTYLLSHILKFEDGSGFQGQLGNGGSGLKYRYYRNRANDFRIRCDEIDSIIIGRLKSYLTGNEVFAKLVERALEQRNFALGKIEAQIDQVDRELQDLDGQSAQLRDNVLGQLKASKGLVGDWLEGQLTELNKSRETRHHRLAALQAEREALRHQSKLDSLHDAVKGFIAGFDKLTGVERRNLIERIIDKAVITRDHKIELHLRAEPGSLPTITGRKKVGVGSVMVGQSLPSPNYRFLHVQVFDSVDLRPRYQFRDRSFLHEKYAVQGLSPEEIAAETFSSRKVIVKHLRKAGIILRTEDRRKTGPLPFGVRRRRYRVLTDKRATLAIAKMKRLRTQGLSYEKIAGVLNTMGIKSSTGRSSWYAKTVRDVLLRDAP